MVQWLRLRLPTQEVCLIPSWGVRIPRLTLKKKNKKTKKKPKTNNTETNSIKTLKLVHTKQSFILFYFYYLFIIIIFFYFTILYWFCHTSTCIRHGCTRVPHPEPPSHFPPRTIPLGHPSAPAPSFLYPASNLDWRFVSYMILYMF